jgi:hypothetical protein
MAQSPQQKPVIDPDRVPETLRDGRFYIHPHGNIATLTFTHARPITSDLFNGTIINEEVVRVRITMPLNNFGALRDLLNNVIKSGDTPMPATGAGTDTKH